MRVYEDDERSAAAAKALSQKLGKETTGYESLTRVDIDLASFGRDIAERGDDYELGLLMLRACSAGFGERQDVRVERELIIPKDAPLLVHGDLHVTGPIVNRSQLLVTGSVNALTLHNGGYATILGDVSARGLSTGGHCYVGGSLTSEVLWAGDFSGSWLLAKSIEARVFIEYPSHALDSRTIHAPVRASVNEANDYPLAMLLADVFATELYQADGMPSRQTLFAWLDEGKDVFATAGQKDTPLALEDFKAWLHGREYRGSQREKLEMLRAKWMRRVSRFDVEATRKVLKGYFKSPKRRDDLAAMLNELASLRG